MKSRRRTRRHPDKWKQRARMRAITRGWNTWHPAIMYYTVDAASLEEYLKQYNVAMQEISVGFNALGIAVKEALTEVAIVFDPLLERLQA